MNDAPGGVVEREVDAGAGGVGDVAAVNNHIIAAGTGGNGGVVLRVGGVNIDLEFRADRRRVRSVIIVGQADAGGAQSGVFQIRAGADRNVHGIRNSAIDDAIIDAAN